MKDKLQRLMDFMAGYGADDICVAFSGGVDSSVVLQAACKAKEIYGGRVYAVTFDTRLHPGADLLLAGSVAKQLGAIHHTITVNEFDNENIMKNPVDRCYLCKSYLFESLKKYAKAKGIEHILEGSNADDLKVYRPGLRAVRELGVISPLAALDITKAEVREIAHCMGLSTASRPSSPCLATRLPYGDTIVFELLERIEQGEDWLKELGFDVVRLRVHNDIARIEIMPEMFSHFFDNKDAIVCRLKELGFTYITLDMEGFRSGSMDVGIDSQT